MHADLWHENVIKTDKTAVTSLYLTGSVWSGSMASGSGHPWVTGDPVPSLIEL